MNREIKSGRFILKCHLDLHLKLTLK